MEIVRYWRSTHERMRLQGNFCPTCEEKFFPQKRKCPNCHGEVVIPKLMPKTGEIFNSKQAFSSAMEASKSSK